MRFSRVDRFLSRRKRHHYWRPAQFGDCGRWLQLTEKCAFTFLKYTERRRFSFIFFVCVCIVGCFLIPRRRNAKWVRSRLSPSVFFWAGSFFFLNSTHGRCIILYHAQSSQSFSWKFSRPFWIAIGMYNFSLIFKKIILLFIKKNKSRLFELTARAKDAHKTVRRKAAGISRIFGWESE